jgi:beta-aspartyl-peptidase (threonine type)
MERTPSRSLIMRGLNCILLSLLVVGPALVVLAVPPAEAPGDESVKNVVLAIHGGEGDLDEKTLTEEEKKKYRETLEQALKEGLMAMKKEGGTCLDGVEAAIRVMEASGLFDAGMGSVLDHDGNATLDASIMRGDDHKAGAVADVTIVKHPISAARAVMEHSGGHVLLVGLGADSFADRWLKDDIIRPGDFVNEKKKKELQDAQEKKKDRRPQPQGGGGPAVGRRRYGTVGAVALWNGTLAAGTSTGGLTDKLPGRVGDSPIIGAGTYADKDTCAVSCTGIGEYFIRYTVAYDIAARMKYKKGVTAEKAADEVVEELKKIKTEEKSDAPDGRGVEGGLIVLDKNGKYTVRYNATQMTRGYIKDDGKPPVVTLFNDEKK